MLSKQEGVRAKQDVMEEKNNRKSIFIIGGGMLVMIIVLLLLLLRSCGRSEDSVVDTTVTEEVTRSGSPWEMDANSEEGGLTYRSQEEIQEEMNRKGEEGMINISMNTSPVFPSGTEKGNLLIVNSEVNNYPQIVYIIRKDTGEEIYRSKGIAVGSKIEYASLDVDLPAGTYECVAYFNNVDPNTGVILVTAGAEILITVES